MHFKKFTAFPRLVPNIFSFHLRCLPHPVHHDAAAGRPPPLLHGADIGAIPSAGTNLRLEDQPNIQRSSIKPRDDYDAVTRSWILRGVHCILRLLLLQRHYWLGIPLPLLLPLNAPAMEGHTNYYYCHHNYHIAD